MTRPDHRTLQAAHTLQQLAPDVTLANETIYREASICDGFPARGESARRGKSELTSVEAAASAARHLHDRADQIRTNIDLIEAAIHRLTRLTQKAIGMRAPVTVPRCRDNQAGRDGNIEWGDTTCEDLPVKAGLCSACYQRERRYRLVHGLAPRDIEAAA